MSQTSLKRWKDLGARGGKVQEDDGSLVVVKTQEQAKRFFSNIRKSYALRSWIPQQTADHAWLCWLIDGHYNLGLLSRTRGVVGFYVHANKDLGYPDVLGSGFSVLLNDGTNKPIHFGVPQALSGIEKTDDAKLAAAMRAAVRDQLTGWRQAYFTQGMRCPVYPHIELHLNLNVEIDHDPEFVVLVQAFLRENGFQENHITTVNSDAGWQIESQEVLKRWREYHIQHARMQFVSLQGHHELGIRRRVAQMDMFAR